MRVHTSKNTGNRPKKHLHPPVPRFVSDVWSNHGRRLAEKRWQSATRVIKTAKFSVRQDYGNRTPYFNNDVIHGVNKSKNTG